MLFETETSALSKYDISHSRLSTYEMQGSAIDPFHTGKVAVIGLALLTSSLHLSDIRPAQQVDRDTARRLVEPYTKDQLLDVQSRDIRMRTIVRRFTSYNEGWDGFNGIPPSSKAIEEAERFISVITKAEILEPYISLAADGEINFYWKNENFILDVGFFGEGVYSIYAKMASGHEVIEDDLSLEDPLPENVASLIRA